MTPDDAYRRYWDWRMALASVLALAVLVLLGAIYLRLGSIARLLQTQVTTEMDIDGRPAPDVWLQSPPEQEKTAP